MPSFTAGNNLARQVRGDDKSDQKPWSAPAVVGAPITAAAAAMFSPTRPHLGKVTPASPRGPRNRRRIQSLLTGEFFTITSAPKRPKRLLRSGPIGAPADQLRWRVCEEYPWRCRYVKQWAWERVEAIEEVPTPITQSGTRATPTEEERWSEEGSGAGAHPEIRESTADGSGAGILLEIIDLITLTPTNSGAGMILEIIDLTLPTPTNGAVIPPEIIDLITPFTTTDRSAGASVEIVDLVTPTTDGGFLEIIDLTTPTTTATDRLLTPTTVLEIIDLVTPTTDGGFIEIIDLISPTTTGAADDDRATPEIVDLITPTTASTYHRP